MANLLLEDDWFLDLLALMEIGKWWWTGTSSTFHASKDADESKKSPGAHNIRWLTAHCGSPICLDAC